MTKKCILLMSGGLDSTTVLAIAKSQEYEVLGVSFDYGQRHKVELEKAKIIAKQFDIEHRIIKIDLRVFGHSALTDDDIDVPKYKNYDQISTKIPDTYVPARNTIFLSYITALSETLGIFDIFTGANQVDYSGYPDCREEYFRAFETMANLATKAGVEGARRFQIITPLLDLSKEEIIKIGLELGVDYSNTLTCYDPTPEGLSCGKCDSCMHRLKGFACNDNIDPAPYVDNLNKEFKLNG